MASGYEKLENQILDLDTLNTKSSVIYSKAYYINDTVFGICNVYNDTVGYLSGGGNYAEEEINHSIYYRYNKNTDTLIEIKRIEQGMIVAFSQNKIIYWKNQNIYFMNIFNNKDILLCKGYSYDSGIQQQSNGVIYFNDKFALFHFTKTKFSSEKEYFYIFNFETEKLISLTYI